MKVWERDMYVTLLQNLLHRMNYNDKQRNFNLPGNITCDEHTALSKAKDALRNLKTEED